MKEAQQLKLDQYSHVEVKEQYNDQIVLEMEESPDKKEVETIIEIQLDEFSNINNLSYLYFSRLGKKVEAPCYLIGNYQIWGATAMIISELVELIKR